MTRAERALNVRDKSLASEPNGVVVRRVARMFTDFREKLVARVRDVNATTSNEVRGAAEELNKVVASARGYARDSEETLARLHGSSGFEDLFLACSQLLTNHSSDMSARATEQDERARSAALTAKTIADLATSIERLAGETRLLAINARIESSRLGVRSSGFAVLASEMKRLSDEVTRTNERVSDMALVLTRILPSIADHARNVRRVMENFSTTAASHIGETDRAVKELRDATTRVAAAGRSVIEDVMRASQNALSHLQFQDVVAQELRRLDAQARQAQVACLSELEAVQAVLAQIPAAEYTALGDAVDSDHLTPPAGDITLF